MSERKKYPFDEIEPKWQEYWVANKTFKTPDIREIETPGPKYYILDMFPYPSGDGLHVGHVEGYTATDVLARYKRMRGFLVMHPMGWDAFGLPAEQHAFDTGIHPKLTTEKNINTFRRQLKALGFSYDWDREVNTTDPKYFKWTQWIFLKLYEKGLAYLEEVPVNWCPALGTVLANEEVINGKSERGDHPVERRPMRQWMLRITAYAERLLEDLDDLDWPDSIKEMQRNWVGKSVGAEVEFLIEADDQEDLKVRVFTTRPDTLFGATYLVLAPEHPWVAKITKRENQAAILSYLEKARNKSDLERTDLAKEKTGVFTGSYALNPVNGKRIPIWTADYVLSGYGTGAIMAVPAHDTRDYEFAKTFGLPIVPVIEGGDLSVEAFTDAGLCINSHADDQSFSIDGMSSTDAQAKIIDWLEKRHIGKAAVQYKLRDWLFSRQRYWGEPMPILHDEQGNMHAVLEKDLPLELPEMDDFKPSGEFQPPLGKARDWVETHLPDGRPAFRETNTMPQWAGSCWYYLRYLDPDNTELPIDSAIEKYWMPVDMYVGGAEHAVLHLLYSRFWHKVLYDCGVVSSKEPFFRLVNQGIILGPDGQKMSKSRKNVVSPDEVIKDYGSDSIRLYEMFLGPVEAMKPWSSQGVEGVYRFLGKVWKWFHEKDDSFVTLADRDLSASELKLLHMTIKKVTDDFEHMRFNTAISALMIFLNDAIKWEDRPRIAGETLLLLLAPLAPHIAEELWQQAGYKETIAYEKWPVHDEAHLKDDSEEIAVQVQGKVRAVLSVPADISEEDLKERALADETVRQWMGDKAVRKIFVVPHRLVNIVVG